MIQFNSIRFKINILYVAILGAILITYSAILYFSLHYTLYHDLDDELRAKAEEVGSFIKAYVGTSGTDDTAFKSAVQKTIRLEKKGPDEENLTPVEVRYLQNVDINDMRNDYINLLDSSGQPLLISEEFHPKALWLFLRKIKMGTIEKSTF